MLIQLWYFVPYVQPSSLKKKNQQTQNPPVEIAYTKQDPENPSG